MGSDEKAKALESAPQAHDQGGQNPASWMVRAASALAGTAACTAVWEVATALRLASLATGLVVRGSAGLADRVGQALGSPGDAGQDLPEEVNRALVMRLYRAAVHADLVTARRLFAEDVSWWVPGPKADATQYRGIDATALALVSIWRQTGQVRAVELRDVVASRERAAALLRLSAIQDGRPVTLDWWVILRIDRGQVTWAWGPFAVEPDGAEPPGNEAQPADPQAQTLRS
jgi:ketosteroid isomerase-like protein